MIGTIKPFTTIGQDEIRAAETAMHGPLSSYLAGKERGGYHVCALEDAWCKAFGVRHAVAVNSATSGLLAACAAVGVSAGDDVITTPFTMSATAAAPAFLGATIVFGDVDQKTFSLKPSLDLITPKTKAAIITNLFGHPGEIAWWRRLADKYGFFLIEDNAQSPFAMDAGRYCGTIGHIGVFSLNYHKHFHCGEGGICVTDDDYLAHKMRMFVNHAEAFAS